MAKTSDIPGGGLMEGVRVVYQAYSIAGPFCAAMMADMGADVIWLEHPTTPDALSLRSGAVGYAWELDRRNQRDMTLATPTPQGKEIFLKLMATTDIFIEASRGGQWDKWGLTDEVLWAVNPKLIIVHISGYGNFGLPDFVKRPSWDPMAQAFSGFMWMNGQPGEKPYPPHVSECDYYAAFTGAVHSIAALRKAEQTGKGESIDVAQYESTLRVMQSYAMEAWNMVEARSVRDKSHNFGVAGFDSYRCKDGNYVYLICLGVDVNRSVCKLLGIEYGGEDMPEGTYRLMARTEKGALYEQRIANFCASLDALDVETAFQNAGVPCGVIQDFKQVQEHPHVIARETLTTWKNALGQEVIGCNLLPHLKNHKYQIWRPAPDKGFDNDDILEELGYSTEQIKGLYEAKVIARPTTEPPKLPNGLKYYDWVK